MVAVSLKKFFFKQKTAYEILRRDWSSDVCSSDLLSRERPYVKLADMTVGLRVPEEQEREGLDVNSHGENAYNA